MTNVSLLTYLNVPLNHGRGQVFMPLTFRTDSNMSMISVRNSYAAKSVDVEQPVSLFPEARDGEHWLPWKDNPTFIEFLRVRSFADARVSLAFVTA